MPATAIILGALGDFLLTLPLLRALRRRGEVACITRGACRALLPEALRPMPFLDVNGADGTGLFTPEAELSERLRRLLRDGDVHAFMRPDPGLERNVRRAGARTLVWHDPRPRKPPHIVARFFREAGLPWNDDILDRPVMPREPGQARALWLHPGSGSPDKTIFPDDLVRLAADEAEAGARSEMIVSFGEADLDLLEPVRKAFHRRGMVFRECVCPTLEDLRLQLAREAARFVGPDTGVTHLAAALGIPCRVVFRGTDPRIWRPVGRVAILREGDAGGNRPRGPSAGNLVAS